MDAEAYEYYEEDDQGVYHQYQEDQNEENDQGYPEYTSQNVYNGEENGQSGGKSSDRANTKLYKSIIKRYGPEDTGSGSKTGSPYKQTQRQDHVQSKFSFHPEINEIPKDIYNNAGRKTEISKEEQWDRLLKPKTGALQERERLKHQKEAQEIQENCTFQPTVNKSYQLTSDKYATNNNQFISDRLYAEGMEKMKSKELARRRSDDADACTFQPDVGQSVQFLKGEKLVQRPIHERLGEIMKQKQEFLQKLRMSAEVSNKDTVFKPAVNEHSQILANAKQQVRDVTERLMKDAADKVYKRMRQNEEMESQLTTLCTFKPNVNPISKSNDDYLATNDLYTVEKDVVTRQYIMADIQREHLQKRAAEIINQEGCTFVPKINKISQFLIEADPNRTNENIQEKMDRLSKKDAQKKEIFQEQMQKAHYEQFKFQPEINKISKEIGKKATLDELAYNRGAKEHLQILREKSIDNMLTACSFKPEVNRNKKYENVEALYRDEEQIMDNVKLLNKKKEIKYDQQRKIEEYNEMKECTFKPRIKGEIAEEALKPKLAQSVAGLDKFIQMRERHKKQQEEKKKREDEVFGIHNKYSATKHEGFTTPQPFNLSRGSKHSIRNTKVIQELREKMTKDYTFKPATNEGKNREIINNMISYGSRMEA